MQVNIISSYRDVVAICDTELLGKQFESEDGKFQLDVKESFYKGEEKTPEETKEIILKMQKEDATFNIAGKESIQIALDAGIITQNNVGEIQGIPFAVVLL